MKPKYSGKGERRRVYRRDLYVDCGLLGHFRLHRAAGWAFGQNGRRRKVSWEDFQGEKEGAHLRWVVDHLKGAKAPGKGAAGVFWQSLELVTWGENERRAKARGEL